MSLGRPPRGEHVPHLRLHDLPRREDQGRVEVALHRLAWSDAHHGVVQRHPPVHPDDVGAGRAHVVQQLPRTHAEVDARDVGDPGKHPRGVRLDKAAVVLRRQRPHPGVEQLHSAGARVDLHPQEGKRDRGQPVEQLRPQLRRAVHQGLGRCVVLRRTTLDEVAGQRERGAREPDQRSGSELAGERLNGLGDVRNVRRGQLPWEVAGAAERLRDHRPHSGDDVEVDPDCLERHDDVAEEDRSVDPESADRLQGDLGDQVGGAAGFQHFGAGA